MALPRCVSGGVPTTRPSVRLVWVRPSSQSATIFHAAYGEMEALVAIDSLEILRGELPRRAISLVLEWATLHRNALREDWQLARAGMTPRPIEPLD